MVLRFGAPGGKGWSAKMGRGNGSQDNQVLLLENQVISHKNNANVSNGTFQCAASTTLNW